MAITLDGTTGITSPAGTFTGAVSGTTGTFTGQATIPTINLTGGQITFPATQSASSDANTLDDYEEGTWTPVVADAGTGGNTGTYNSGSAYYTKIGRQVSVQAYISGINTPGMTSGNIFFLRGLPFVPASPQMGNFYSYRLGRNASTVSSCTTVSASNSWIFFSIFTTNSATVDAYILVSNIVSGTSEIILSVTYFV